MKSCQFIVHDTNIAGVLRHSYWPTAFSYKLTQPLRRKLLIASYWTFYVSPALPV
jgi:hypothetical protein